jgi:hypothetical protein
MKGGEVCSERQEEAGTSALARRALERPAGTCSISASLSYSRCPQAAHSTRTPGEAGAARRVVREGVAQSGLGAQYSKTKLHKCPPPFEHQKHSGRLPGALAEKGEVDSCVASPVVRRTPSVYCNSLPLPPKRRLQPAMPVLTAEVHAAHTVEAAALFLDSMAVVRAMLKTGWHEPANAPDLAASISAVSAESTRVFARVQLAHMRYQAGARAPLPPTQCSERGNSLSEAKATPPHGCPQWL